MGLDDLFGGICAHIHRYGREGHIPLSGRVSSILLRTSPLAMKYSAHYSQAGFSGWGRLFCCCCSCNYISKNLEDCDVNITHQTQPFAFVWIKVGGQCHVNVNRWWSLETEPKMENLKLLSLHCNGSMVVKSQSCTRMLTSGFEANTLTSSPMTE